MPLSLAQMSTSGPIPGESLTRAPGDSPWEKPPQYTTVDQAMNFLLGQFQNKQVVHKFLALLEAGAPMNTLVGTMLKHGFAEGKWTPSLMLLLITPLSTLMVRLAKQAGIKYIPSYKGNSDPTLDTLFQLIDKKKKQNKVSAPEVKRFMSELKSYKSDPDKDGDNDLNGQSTDNDNPFSDIPSGGLMSPPANMGQ